MRLLPPDGGPLGTIVDLLSATSGIEPDICEAADSLEVLDGVVAPVATVGHLIAMKLLSRDDDHRPQDIIDLHALIGIASDEDIAAGCDAPIPALIERASARSSPAQWAA